MWSQFDAEQIAHLAIEVGEAGLGAGDDADLDVALRAEALGENAQRDGLAGAGGAGDEGEAASLVPLLRQTSVPSRKPVARDRARKAQRLRF